VDKLLKKWMNSGSLQLAVGVGTGKKPPYAQSPKPFYAPNIQQPGTLNLEP
jgi:hypothetical protein